MKRIVFTLLSSLIAVLFLPYLGYSDRGIQVQEKRFALVIGNGNYKSSPLRNPTNDAHDVALVLKTLGFEVTHLENAGYRAMERAIRNFGKQLRNGGAGLFYFAGHGIQVDGRNYLIPVDAEIETESDVKFEAVDAGRVLGKMEDAENDLNIVILDACRDNPFARSFRANNQGLARMDAPKGSLIAYATAPGSVAADGEGRNGLYTKYLIKNATLPGLTIEQILKKVRIEVLKETNNKQVPWESSSLTGNFYFNPIKAEVKPAATEQPKITKSTQRERLDKDYETLFWDSIKTSKDADAFKAYLKKFPNGVFSELARININKYSQQIEEKPDEKLSADSQKMEDEERLVSIKESKVGPKKTICKLAIFPSNTFRNNDVWAMSAHEMVYQSAITTIDNFALKQPKITLRYSYYPGYSSQDKEIINRLEVEIIDTLFDKKALNKLWAKKSFNASYEPDITTVIKFAKKINADMVLMYRYGWGNNFYRTEPIYTYLIDTRTEEIYTASGKGSGDNLDSKIEEITKRVLEDFLRKYSEG